MGRFFLGGNLIARLIVHAVSIVEVLIICLFSTTASNIFYWVALWVEEARSLLSSSVINEGGIFVL